MSGSKEKLKNLWMMAKEESKKSGLKLNIKKTNTIASNYITSWQIDGDIMEILTGFIFLFIYFFLSLKSLQMVTAVIQLKDTYSLEKKL